jgi:hypothetical protein
MRSVLAFLICVGLMHAADIEIPFDFLHSQIVLRAQVDGQGPFNFIVDTGTGESTMDAGLARRLGLELGPLVPVTGAGGGSAMGRKGVCRQLRIGGLPPADLAVTAVELSGVSRALGRPLHGVLGFGFLSQYVVEIDYFRRVVGFSAATPHAREQSGAVAFPMRFGPNSVLPVLDEFYVNGARVPVTLDTGSSLGLVLFPNAIRLLNLEALAREAIPIQASGYLGEAQLSKGWVMSAKMKDIDLGAIEAAYVRKGYGDAEDAAQRGGSLGNTILQEFRVTLDYPRRIVTLERNAE